MIIGRKQTNQDTLIYPRALRTTKMIVNSPGNPIPRDDDDEVVVAIVIISSFA